MILKLKWKIKICREEPRTHNLNIINGVTHTSYFKHSHSFVEISKCDFDNTSDTDQEHMTVISEMDSYVVSPRIMEEHSISNILYKQTQ